MHLVAQNARAQRRRIRCRCTRPGRHDDAVDLLLPLAAEEQRILSLAIGLASSFRAEAENYRFVDDLVDQAVFLASSGS
jgi:hypothetical protein